MQTFLPYPSFEQSAKVLDYRRLGKQRVETMQILNTLQGKSDGWKNHPAVKMWRGYEKALKLYGIHIVAEWVFRGYRNNISFDLHVEVDYPPWLGNKDFHLSHQSNLIRKDKEFYGPKFPDVPNNLPYIWPV